MSHVGATRPGVLNLPTNPHHFLQHHNHDDDFGGLLNHLHEFWGPWGAACLLSGRHWEGATTQREGATALEPPSAAQATAPTHQQGAVPRGAAPSLDLCTFPGGAPRAFLQPHLTSQGPSILNRILSFLYMNNKQNRQSACSLQN